MELLSVSGVSKSYKKFKAVDGISLSLEQGEVLGLLGPNGAGKSTTISMIATLMKPDEGDILYNGTSIIKNPKLIQKNLGFVPQDIALYPLLSGYENLKFWGRAYGLKGSTLNKAIDEVSEIIGIRDRLKDRVKNYSGGMARRLNIGVALLHHPELIIMDEPTVGIDPQSRKHILDTVKILNEERHMSVIYTSHYMEEVEYLCNRICIMDQGKVISSGTKQELIQSINPVSKILLTVEGDVYAGEKAMKDLPDIRATVEDGKIIIESLYHPQLFQTIMTALSDKGISIRSLQSEEADLESVFLELTGRELRD